MPTAVSINIELPTSRPGPARARKDATGDRQPMARLRAGIDDARTKARPPQAAGAFAPAGQSTQMIVGATTTHRRRDPDDERRPLQRHRLRRVYYSAFSPIPTPSRSCRSAAAAGARTPALSGRLADALLRLRVDELTTTARAECSTFDIDPKLAWALRHRDAFPVDLNRPRELLLRVPGLGVSKSIASSPRAAGTARGRGPQRLRVPLGKTLPFIVTADHPPRSAADVAQLRQLRPAQPEQLDCSERVAMHASPARRSTTDFTGWRRPRACCLHAMCRRTRSNGSTGGWRTALARSMPTARTMPRRRREFRVPRRLHGARTARRLHRDPRRWALLYRMLWRLTHGEPRPARIAIDDDVAHARRWQSRSRATCTRCTPLCASARSRRRTARLRRLVRARAPHRRSSQRRSSCALRRHALVDPHAGPRAHWDGERCASDRRFTQRCAGHDALEDAVAVLLREHLQSRAREDATMQAEMPKNYWKNLPEARIDPGTDRTRDASNRDDERKIGSTAAYRLARRDAAAETTSDRSKSARGRCTLPRCPLWSTRRRPSSAKDRARAMMFVGEQPGDPEDRAGRPFVGPAGQLLDRALAAAGIRRDTVYVTNAVKHFKWEPRQAPAAPHAGAARNRRVPPVAGTRDRTRQTGARRGDGRHSDARDHGRAGESQRDARAHHAVEVRQPAPRHLGHPAAILRASPAAQDVEYERFAEDICLARPFAHGEHTDAAAVPTRP